MAKDSKTTGTEKKNTTSVNPYRPNKNYDVYNSDGVVIGRDT